MPNMWLFQANPSYSLLEEIPRFLGKTDDWNAARYRNQMRKGDRVILWQSGPESGVYGFGRLKSEARKVRGGYRVDIGYEPLLRRPIFKKELLKHPILRNLGVLKMPRGKNPYPVKETEWQALQEIISRDTVSIFTPYQGENRFTNGLVALLQLSSRCNGPLPITSFLRDLLVLEPRGEIASFRVLQGFDGHADAELCGTESCIRLETKIGSGALDEKQVQRHLKWLERAPQALKVLVLLTPDDSSSGYIKGFLSSKCIQSFCSKGRNHKVMPLGWKHVYDHLRHSVASSRETVFSRLVSQFLEQVRDTIFEQDFAGIIQKVNFAKGGIDPHTFVTEIKAWRKGDYWDTPREYEKLHAKGRKLLLYDSKSDEKGILAEVEIERVQHMRGGGDFPWRNIFASRPIVFSPPIPLDRIRSIAGFEDFGKPGGKDMTPFRNITREQYRLLRGIK